MPISISPMWEIVLIALIVICIIARFSRADAPKGSSRPGRTAEEAEREG